MLASARDGEHRRRVAIEVAQQVRREPSREIDVVERSNAVGSGPYDVIEREVMSGEAQAPEQLRVLAARPSRAPLLHEHPRRHLRIDRDGMLGENQRIVALDAHRLYYP